MSVSAAPRGRDRKHRLRGAVRRERILDAATQVFAEKGYDAASFGDIAELCGVTRPVLYDHFRSKEDLHLRLLELERDRVLEHVKVQLLRDDTPQARVFRALDVFFAYVETHPYAWRMLFRETSGDSAMAAAQRRIQTEAHLAVAAMLAREPGSRILAGRDKDVRLEMLAALWGSATNGLARWWYDRRDVARSDIVAAAMDALWLGVERLRAGERSRTPARATKEP
jgi:AcrR family transcriptional regulator